jgi:hypothetical protein
VRTSASLSFSRGNVGIDQLRSYKLRSNGFCQLWDRTESMISITILIGIRALCRTSVKWFETMYRTLQLLSPTAFLICTIRCSLTSAGVNCCAIAIKSWMVSSRTESWSSLANFRYMGRASVRTCCFSNNLTNGYGMRLRQSQRILGGGDWGLTPKCFAAARRTMGVSSAQSFVKAFRRSSCVADFEVE